MRLHRHDARFIDDERPHSRGAGQYNTYIGERAPRHRLIDLLDGEEFLRFWAISQGSFALKPTQAERLELMLDVVRREVMHTK